MSDHRSMHVSLVVLAIDDFTGRTITDKKVNVLIEGQKPIAVKEDGYRVFVNLHEKKVTLSCKSRYYQPQSKEIALAQIDEQEVFILRLVPSPEYPFPDGVTSVRGQTRANATLWFWSEEQNGYKLLSDYHAENEMLEIYVPKERILLGKAFLICDRERGNKELFRITEKKERQYRMDRRLSHDYKKTAAIVTPAHEITADESGRFFLAFPKDQDSIKTVFCRTEAEAEQSIVLRAGTCNTLYL